ncbi:glucose-1-phosphate adenylyltransferase [Striga asiatica]|uniref:Glucose-1-phosphate adenylyltransferase n=1 Tax=Striga asiatica TaxID=4170 RepID=A0A5A7PMM4_STRAF|nr:glucose-1-phosphate adenylyltransferase [Striga asiatica]
MWRVKVAAAGEVVGLRICVNGVLLPMVEDCWLSKLMRFLTAGSEDASGAGFSRAGVREHICANPQTREFRFGMEVEEAPLLQTPQLKSQLNSYGPTWYSGVSSRTFAPVRLNSDLIHRSRTMYRNTKSEGTMNNQQLSKFG